MFSAWSCFSTSYTRLGLVRIKQFNQISTTTCTWGTCISFRRRHLDIFVATSSRWWYSSQHYQISYASFMSRHLAKQSLWNKINEYILQTSSEGSLSPYPSTSMSPTEWVDLSEWAGGEKWAGLRLAPLIRPSTRTGREQTCSMLSRLCSQSSMQLITQYIPTSILLSTNTTFPGSLTHMCISSCLLENQEKTMPLIC